MTDHNHRSQSCPLGLTGGARLGWLVGWLVGRSVGRLCWLVGRSVGQLCWMVGRLADLRAITAAGRTCFQAATQPTSDESLAARRALSAHRHHKKAVHLKTRHVHRAQHRITSTNQHPIRPNQDTTADCKRPIRTQYAPITHPMGIGTRTNHAARVGGT